MSFFKTGALKRLTSFFSKRFAVGERDIGENAPVFIIAEAGVAHFGSIEKAKALVDLAVSAEADAVKFQVFKTEELISKESEEWIERLKTKELPYEAFREIRDYCSRKGIVFFTRSRLPSKRAAKLVPAIVSSQMDRNLHNQSELCRTSRRAT